MQNGVKLVFYSEAKKALAVCRRTDEVKDIRDKAVAMQVYAQQAKDRELIEHATEIRLRAEIRVGELLRNSDKNKGARNQLRGDVPVGGRAPTPPTDKTPRLSDLGITKKQSSRWQKMASMPVEKQEAKIAATTGKLLASLDGHAGRPAAGGGSVEWFTPAEYIEKARKVLGDIDLDPASCKTAQRVVKAKKFYTREQDGLQQSWSGRVWLNPPYSQPDIAHFAEKMVNSLADIQAAVMLTNSATDTGWFQSLAQKSNAICLFLARTPGCLRCRRTGCGRRLSWLNLIREIATVQGARMAHILRAGLMFISITLCRRAINQYMPIRLTHTNAETH